MMSFASNGDAQAMLELSQCYRYGKDTTKHLQQAEYFWEKAQEQGSEDADT